MRENHILLTVNCVFIFDGRPITHRTYFLLIFLHIHIYYMLKHSYKNSQNFSSKLQASRPHFATPGTFAYRCM